MRVEIDVVRKLDPLAVDGEWFPDLKIRRATYYPDGTYFRHEYLSFLTGEWVAKDATGIPSQCIYDDKLRAIMNADDKRPRSMSSIVVDSGLECVRKIAREMGYDVWRADEQPT